MEDGEGGRILFANLQSFTRKTQGWRNGDVDDGFFEREIRIDIDYSIYD